MGKKNITVDDYQRISNGSGKRLTYKDLGYNDFLEKVEVVEQREKSAKRLMEQEEHEMKMKVYEKQLKQLDIQDKVPKEYFTSKLIIYSSGLIKYVINDGRKYEKKFSQNTNAVRLLKRLATDPGSLLSAKIINDSFKSPKASADTPDPDRRVRDTITYIQNEMGLPKNKSFFIVDSGRFGLSCVVELRN